DRVRLGTSPLAEFSDGPPIAAGHDQAPGSLTAADLRRSSLVLLRGRSQAKADPVPERVRVRRPLARHPTDREARPLTGLGAFAHSAGATSGIDCPLWLRPWQGAPAVRSRGQPVRKLGVRNRRRARLRVDACAVTAGQV